LTSAEFEIVPKVPSMGTGFFVGVHDDRLKENENFVYLVTNRHMAQPGIEDEKPCVVMNYSLLMNKKSNAAGSPDTLEISRLGHTLPWHYSDDASVDLAVIGATLNEGYDALWVPESIFITEEMIKTKEVVEGDPVLFAGLFIQTFNDVHPTLRKGAKDVAPELLGLIRNGKWGPALEL
jgi:hypothetical protein